MSFRTGQMPAPSDDSFVGRADDVSAVTERLERFSCVTLIGPGGVGKTRLARELAARLGPAWDAQTVFVDLCAVLPEDDVNSLIVAAMRDAGGAGDTVSEVVRALAPCLIVLDNLEQLASVAADLVTVICEADEHVRVLCTSRTPLSLAHEAVVTVAPLSAEDALELLEDRAARAGAASVDLGSLVAPLGGLPLAIELAAARLRVLGPTDLLACLEDEGLMKESFDWSWRLLSDAERRDIGLLAPIGGPFLLRQAATTFAESHAATATRLGALVDGSLLQMRRVGGQSQYVMLEPIRRSAMHKLRDEHPDLYGTAVRRHAESWLAESSPGRSLTGVARIVRDVEVVEPHLAVQVAIRSLDPLYVRHNAQAASRIVRRALAACTDSMTKERIDLLCVAAAVWARHVGDLRRASELVDEAFDLGEGVAERRISVRNARGMLALAADDLDAAETWLRAGIALEAEAPDDPARASARANLGLCLLAQGAFEEAAEWLHAALQAELPPMQSHAVRGRLAVATHYAGRASVASELLERGRDSARDAGLADAALSYGLHLARLRIDLDPWPTLHAAMRHDDPALALDAALIAWTLGDGSSLTKLLERFEPRAPWRQLWWVASGANALVSLRAERGVEGLEHVRRALGHVSSAEPAARAVLARIAADAARVADRAAEAQRWQETARTEAARCAVARLVGLVDGDDPPPHQTLVQDRARHETRFSRWSWIDLALALGGRPRAAVSTRAPDSAWRFANEARLVQTPEGKTLNLGRRGAMRKILWHLVQKHDASPGVGTTVDDAFEIGWPGEILDYELALARVYNTIRAARALGFEDLIITRDDGYLLDPAQQVVMI